MPLRSADAVEKDAARQFLASSDSENLIINLDCVEKTRALLANEADSVCDSDLDADDIGDDSYSFSALRDSEKSVSKSACVEKTKALLQNEAVHLDDAKQGAQAFASLASLASLAD